MDGYLRRAKPPTQPGMMYTCFQSDGAHDRKMPACTIPSGDIEGCLYVLGVECRKNERENVWAWVASLLEASGA